MSVEERSRYADFCQFRRVIRGSREHLIVGIDIAKEKHYAFLGTATGKTLLKRVIFENTRQGFAKLLTFTEAMRTHYGLSHVVGEIGGLVFCIENLGDRSSYLHVFKLDEKKDLVPTILMFLVKASRRIADAR